MNADDNFLARWSRRKQAVSGTERTAPAKDAQPGAPPLRAESGAAAGDQAETFAAVPTEIPPLPSIDDLTAESDVSTFLLDGVPEALKRAALRRVWSLDPAIRDYISPADYAWDFNNPASIPGFGGDIDRRTLDKIVTHSARGKPQSPLGEPSQASDSGLPELDEAEPKSGRPESGQARAGEESEPTPSEDEFTTSTAEGKTSGGLAASPPPHGEQAVRNDEGNGPALPHPPRHGGATPQ